jgi:NAD(P)-dependent dehydrogenase (short-subunit alcohol dehydrogenase family)
MSRIATRSHDLPQIPSTTGQTDVTRRTVYCLATDTPSDVHRAVAATLLHHGINLQTVASSLTQPATTAGSSDDVKAHPQLLAQLALGRPATAEQVTAAAAYLAFKETEPTTCPTIAINEGWTAQ